MVSLGPIFLWPYKLNRNHAWRQASLGQNCDGELTNKGQKNGVQSLALNSKKHVEVEALLFKGIFCSPPTNAPTLAIVPDVEWSGRLWSYA
jgi:hypothetical protein